MTLKKLVSNDDDDDQPADEVAAGGGGERPLDPFELHRLACEDYNQLERRAAEITEENINATCSLDNGNNTEVI